MFPWVRIKSFNTIKIFTTTYFVVNVKSYPFTKYVNWFKISADLSPVKLNFMRLISMKLPFLNIFQVSYELNIYFSRFSYS